MSKIELPNLFKPIKVGPYQIQHRVALAPMSRLRAPADGVPGDLMLEYYAQRTSNGGLMVTESTVVSQKAGNHLYAPGIYTKEQVLGWNRVTDAVHKRGGTIFLQLWHGGRLGHVSLNGGNVPTGPSETSFAGYSSTEEGWVPATPHRALRTDEIPELIKEYTQAARRAKEAGFDGVELHGGNGYLIDQFLQDGSNLRKDQYGGSVENRVRFLSELTDSVAEVMGADKVGVRLSPSGVFNGMSDSNPLELFSHAASEMDRFGLAYLHLIEPRVNGDDLVEQGAESVAAAHLRSHFSGTIIAAGGFGAMDAEETIAQGHADLVAFGRLFLANPDLPERFRNGYPLNAYDRSTFYGGTTKGYSDYPAYVGA